MNAAGKDTLSDRLILAGELTIYTVSETFKRVQDYLNRPPPYILDLSGITELDGAGLQLLLWLRDMICARGDSLRLAGQSPTVSEIFALLQLGSSFGDSGGCA